MIFISSCSKNSRLQDPSLVNKCSVCVLWPYFSDFFTTEKLKTLKNFSFSLTTHKRCFLKTTIMYINAANILL